MAAWFFNNLHGDDSVFPWAHLRSCLRHITYSCHFWISSKHMALKHMRILTTGVGIDRKPPEQRTPKVQIFMASIFRLYQIPSGWPAVAEFCYNLQYVDLNGRNRGDPWSLRQCGVYQQICLKTCRSRWVLLQVSDKMRAQLDQALQNRSQKNVELGINPMVPHVIFISAMAVNWQEYLEHLQVQLSVLVNELSCSLWGQC